VDISLGSGERDQISFSEFAELQLDRVTRAIAVANAKANAEPERSLQAVLAHAHAKWSVIGFREQAENYVFTQATATAEPQPAAVPIAVARWGLDWSVDRIAHAFTLDHGDVVELLSTADAWARSEWTQEDGSSNGSNDPASDGLPYRIRTAMQQVSAELPDALAIQAQADKQYSRRRRSLAGVAVAAVALLLIVAGTLLGQADRRAVSQAALAPNLPKAPLQAPAPTQTATAPQAFADFEQSEPAQPIEFRSPEFITSDRAGGFAGLRGPTNADPSIVFAQSQDGVNWSTVHRSRSRPDLRVQKFSRSGSQYVIVSQHPVFQGTSIIGVSSNLTEWNWLDLSLEDQAPGGIKFDVKVLDVEVDQRTLLVLVGTEVEIDYAALNLIEAYTCGRLIDANEVTVKLCNGGRLQVLDAAGAKQVPAPSRLFISRTGNDFVEVPGPFGPQTSARLERDATAFVVTDARGFRFARSRDGLNWQSSSTFAPPANIATVATNHDGAFVGIGASGGEPALFAQQPSRAMITTRLTDIVPDVGSRPNAIVASNADQWAVYLYNQRNAWLLSSTDALNWTVNATAATPSTGTPTLVLGEDTAVIQWVDGAGSPRMTIVPI